MKFKTPSLPAPDVFILAGIFLLSLALVWYGIGLQYGNADSMQDDLFLKGKVVSLLDEQVVREEAPFSREYISQRLSVRLEEPYEGEREVTARNDLVPVREGQRVYVNPTFFQEENAGGVGFRVVEVDKIRGMFLLAAALALFIVLVGRMRGVRSLVNLVFTFAVIFSFIVPFILRGDHPVLVGLAGSMAILIVTLYAAYGVNRKSISAFLGILGALLVVAVLAFVSVSLLRFTGFAAEGALILLNIPGVQMVNLVDLLIAGIIIAGIGVLDDVAVSQASTVQELRRSNPALKGADLFQRGMEVGRDHIASVVNTLVLAYTGASLPTILLLVTGGFSMSFALSNELVAMEIVRTIVATFGLVLAVPLTTAIAAALFSRGELEHEDGYYHL